MNHNQKILFALMDDLPHDPFKARVVAWQRLHRKSRGLGIHDIVDKSEYNDFLEWSKISKTQFPWKSSFGLLLAKQMGSSAFDELSPELREMADSKKTCACGQGAPVFWCKKTTCVTCKAANQCC